jgi:hypothetical protein
MQKRTEIVMNYRLLQEELERLGVIEFEPHRFTADSSDLGFPIGQWPAKIETNMGNGLPFIQYHAELRDGDLLWVSYKQDMGCITLKVFND